MIYFQFYPAYVNSKKPIGTVSLHEFLKANQDPNEKLKKVFRLIKVAEEYKNIRWKAFLKQNFLYYFTPCVQVGSYVDNLGRLIDSRGYGNIKSFTGLMVLDFDHIDNAEAFKYYLFGAYTCIIAAWLSPSKRGVKFLVQIPIVNDTNTFKEYYFGIATEMDLYKGFDGTGQNCVLPLFLSYDPDLLYREDATTWTKRGKKIDAFQASNKEIVKIEIGEGEKAQVQRIIITLVDRIIDNGHPQIRSAAVVLGGYIATGYIDQYEGENFIYNLIASNAYLSKGIDGYKKTAKTAIQVGMQSQLFLK